MTSPSPDVLASYLRLAEPFASVVDRVPNDAWDSSSPCKGWSARDVLTHVVTTQRDFLEQRGVDAATAADGSDPRAVWQAHDERMRELLADPDVAGQEYDGVFGRTTVGASIVTFYGFDLVVHRWDIAVAAGLDEHLSDEELEMLDRSADGFGDHLYDDGVCKPAVPVRDGADRQERVLARLGRPTPAHA
ncbi:TIGR03086 family metal-binding protein [Terracoccus sp. 273MFTsu3.1]|uniref:TIGR03086 family metal-binding protein n=1 Tax=Terracoccus sp. 273MFTsu3.1 TaxID=1172188 RepID=UPI00037A65A8|nr:TIGR03086 family metal-binding protein [Terracoccus sp. 273MFTsu3.1]